MAQSSISKTREMTNYEEISERDLIMKFNEFDSQKTNESDLLEMVKLLFRDGKQITNSILLSLACRHNYIELAELLFISISNNKDFNIDKILWDALLKKNKTLADFLIAHGANFNLVDVVNPNYLISDNNGIEFDESDQQTEMKQTIYKTIMRYVDNINSCELLTDEETKREFFSIIENNIINPIMQIDNLKALEQRLILASIIQINDKDLFYCQLDNEIRIRPELDSPLKCIRNLNNILGNMINKYKKSSSLYGVSNIYERPSKVYTLQNLSGSYVPVSPLSPVTADVPLTRSPSTIEQNSQWFIHKSKSGNQRLFIPKQNSI